MVREGLAEIHQHQAFAPIYMRKRTAVAAVVSEPAQGDAQGPAIDRTED
jgi:hypothetical protein